MDENNTTIPTTDNEQGSFNAPYGTKEFKRFDRQVDIHIHSKRNRLTDCDGGFSKYVVDSLVSCGILQDDRPEKVRKITYSQEKTGELEETIITITEVNI